MPKERWNVLILDTLLAIVGFVRFVNDTGNYLTIKRKVLASLTFRASNLLLFIKRAVSRGYIIEKSCHFGRRHLSKILYIYQRECSRFIEKDPLFVPAQ